MRPSSPISTASASSLASSRQSPRTLPAHRRIPSLPAPASSSSLNTGINSEVAENIRVAVRVRPKTSKESALPVAVIVENDNEMVVSRQRFRFDQVFSEHTSQEEIFKSMAAPLVESVCQGTNCALFAYGQTGTGKTFTMLGFDLWQLATAAGDKTSASVKLDTLEKNEMRGVIPRAMKYLFALLQGKPHKVSVSYLEIYNEKILDLLANASPSMDNLELREDKNGLVQVIDATVKRVNSLAEVLEYLWKGAKNRAVSSTDMNEHSSRSHTIFQVTVEIKHSPEVTTKAKLNLIDLAGSEKWRPHLEFSDQRIAEMTSINQSLSNLGNCVRALLRPGKNHIPYRNSKLTRLVSDSLGGNAKTGFVVTVSPSELAHEETISTLQFADRAKKVVVRNEANYVETSEMVLKRLEQELQKQVRENKELREQLQQQQQPQHAAPSPSSSFLTTVSSTSNSNSNSHMQSISQLSLASSASSMAKTTAEELSVTSSSTMTTKALSKALNIARGDSTLMSQPQEFLQDYHDHLRNRTSDGLTSMERLALLEWSVTLQSEQLNQSIAQRKEDAKRIALLQQELFKSQDRFLQEQSKPQQQPTVEDKSAVLELERQVLDLKRLLTEAQTKAISQHQQQDAEIGELRRKLAATATTSVERDKTTPLKKDDSKPSLGRQMVATPSSSSRNGGVYTTPSHRMETPQPDGNKVPRTFHSSRATPRAAAATAATTNRAKATTTPRTNSSTPQTAAQVWDRYVEDATGKAYFHCKETGQTTWKRPTSGTGHIVIVRGE
ncbi:hypothetical protein BASA81_011038 [Batrachochytrium salamandrivorans]|nr:hypothetical protein BASA81_011038 [Batrachochytrium salamandrivorans]